MNPIAMWCRWIWNRTWEPCVLCRRRAGSNLLCRRHKREFAAPPAREAAAPVAVPWSDPKSNPLEDVRQAWRDADRVYRERHG